MIASLKGKSLTATTPTSCQVRAVTPSEKFFAGLEVLIVPNILGISRCEVLKKKLIEYGGTCEIYSTKKPPTCLEAFSHIVVDQSVSYEKAVLLIAGTKSTDASLPRPVVTSKWLSACLEEKKLLDIEPFRIHNVDDSLRGTPASTGISDITCKAEPCGDEPVVKKVKSYRMTTSAKLSDLEDTSDNTDTDSSEDGKLHDAEPGTTSDVLSSSPRDLPITQLKNKDRFMCMTSSAVSASVANPNQHIVDKLQEMVEAYKSTKDKWRAFSYEKAIIALKASNFVIDSYEKAAALPSVGKRLAEKIWEIAESGSLRKLELFQNDESVQAAQLFMRIWGVGPETANHWAEQGFRSIEDVKSKAKLSTNQMIGLRYFSDFDERMAREEVTRIEAVVREVVVSLCEGLMVTTCGSYRRGKLTCGDVDILITHPDGHSHKGIFEKLLDTLHQIGFLTDDLTVQLNMTGGMAKYLGVCVLPEKDAKHRRIDIIVTPYDQYGCALLYFTGSAHFNRSMRLMADKMGMSLTEHYLYKDVIRKDRQIIHHGTIVNTPTEEDVFAALGIPYRRPEERDHS